MPRDAMGNIIPGGIPALTKPMNPSPRAAQVLQGTQRALANPAADIRNPAATAALQRANAGVVQPPAPLRQGAPGTPLRGDVTNPQPALPPQANPSDRAILALRQDQARLQAARAGAQPLDIAAQQQQAQLQQRMRPIGLGTAITR